MRKLVLFLAVIGTCIGCSGSQVQEAGSSAPDYEIVSEQEEDASNLNTKTVEVSTDSIKSKELRRIAEEIKSDNTNQDALSIEFYKDAPGQSEGRDDPSITGGALVMNNEKAAKQLDEAVNQVFGLPLPSDAVRERILNENNGIDVIAFAQIQQDMQEVEEEMDQEMNQDLEEMEQGMERDMREMEKEMEQLPKPPKP